MNERINHVYKYNIILNIINIILNIILRSKGERERRGEGGSDDLAAAQ